MSNLTSNVHTIAAMGLQWWEWLVGIGIPTGVIILFNYLSVVFRDIKLIKHGKEYTCDYTKKQIWQNHLVVRWFIRIHRPWGIEKKYDKAIKTYETCVELANTEITSIVTPIFDNADLLLPVYDGRIKGHLKGFIRRDFIPSAIIDVVIGLSGNKLLIEPISSGFELSVGAWILARSDSEDKLKKLRALLQSPIDTNNAVKELAANIQNAENLNFRV